MEKNIRVKMELTDGKVLSLELYPDIAPLSCANFVKLVNDKFYDGLCFHRIIPGFMIQGGGFIAENGGLKSKESAQTVKGEFKSNGVVNTLHHEPGVISMARTNVKDSATSQFFICAGDTSFLDGNYAAFGKVTDAQSLAAVMEISKVPTGFWRGYDDVPLTPVVIKSVTIA